MRLMIGIFLLIFAPISFAQEIYTNGASDSHQYLYSDGGAWHIDTISADANQWPQIQNTLTFANEREARAYLDQTGAYPSPRAAEKFRGHELVNRNGSTLWKVTNQWNWNWEVKFGEWVKNELHISWWKNYGVGTDCADVMYSARWIFARNNGLPVANSTKTGAWITQNTVMPEWEQLPTDPEWFKDQKFLAGLKYLLAHTYTHTLWADGYPIEMNARALIPGTYHLHLADETGHTMLVQSVGTKPEEVPIVVIYSTVPSEVRDLWTGVFLDDISDAAGVGFLRMRWPQWSGNVVSLVPAQLMPFYSAEEFDPNFIQGNRRAFWEEVFFRLNPQADFNKIAYKILEQLLDGFRARVEIVEKGWNACKVNKCAEKSAEFEMWSTPTRDGRLLGAVEVFDESTLQVTDFSQFRPLFAQPVVTIDRRTYDLNEVIGAWRAGNFSSDPNDEPTVRWGL